MIVDGENSTNTLHWVSIDETNGIVTACGDVAEPLPGDVVIIADSKGNTIAERKIESEQSFLISFPLGSLKKYSSPLHAAIKHETGDSEELSMGSSAAFFGWIN